MVGYFTDVSSCQFPRRSKDGGGSSDDESDTSVRSAPSKVEQTKDKDTTQKKSTKDRFRKSLKLTSEEIVSKEEW